MAERYGREITVPHLARGFCAHGVVCGGSILS
jgi:hypothetical protein